MEKVSSYFVANKAQILRLAYAVLLGKKLLKNKKEIANLENLLF